MDSFVEISLVVVLPFILPSVVAFVSASFFAFPLFFCKKIYSSFFAMVLSVLFVYFAVRWSLAFPSSMENDWFCRNLIPFLDVTFY